LLLKEYKALGGLQGSIAAAVKEAWKNPGHDPVIPSDNASRRTLLHQVFPYLVMLDHEADKPKRRVATWSLLPPETYPLLERLVAARLLLKDRRTLADGQEDVVVEVAHEALIRHWALLENWVEANREFLAWEHRLRGAIRHYEERHKNTDFLLRGFALTEAQEWVKKQPNSVSPEARAFVTASQKKRARDQFVTGLIATLLGIVMSGTIWLWQKGYSVEQAFLKIRSVFISIHVPPQMVPIPGGIFQMGDVDLEEAAWGIPVHPVRIKPFKLGKYEVTFEEYDRFAITEGRPLPNDQGWGRSRRPVIYVSWEEAKAYAEWLSQKMGSHYRLPTEAEWEYAARSGAKQEVWAGTSEKSHIGNFAVLGSNSGKHTSIVGEKEPNGFELHDMSGNVWEWIEDCWHENYSGAPEDGTAWQEASKGDCGQRILRGGSWLNPTGALRTSNRFRATSPNRNNDIGFRLAQDVAP
jgi:formylglycine-generating enzyme required for sulfatase activity